MNAPLTLIDAVEAMVAQKRTVGYKYEAEEAGLYRFVTFTRSQFPGLEAELAIEKDGQRIEPAASQAMKPAASREEFTSGFEAEEGCYQDLINRSENLTADEMIAEAGEIKADFNQLCERYKDTFSDNASGELTNKSQSLQQQINDIIERKNGNKRRITIRRRSQKPWLLRGYCWGMAPPRINSSPT